MASAQIPSTGKGAPAGTVLKRPQYRVSVKDKWSDGSWTHVAYLTPLQVSIAAAPLKSSAAFKWLTGRIRYEDAGAFKEFKRQAGLMDQFVRVEVLASGSGSRAELFVGRFVAEGSELQGTDSSTGQTPRGAQVLRAVGVAHELDRSPVMGSWFTNGGENPEAEFMDTQLVFNDRFDRRGPTEVGNRSLTKARVEGEGDQTVKEYVFAGRKPDGGSSSPATKPWTVGDIVRYLLTFYTPDGLPFVLGGQADALDNFILPRVNLAGKTVFEALNVLIDRRRGLGWCTRAGKTPGGKDAAEVHVYSVLDEALKFDTDETEAGKKTIPANAEQFRLDVDGLGHLVEGLSVERDSLSRFGKVVVDGARVLVCFTAEVDTAHPDATSSAVLKGWNAAEETAYKNGDGLTTEADAKAKDKNDQKRGDVSLQHVFSHFRINPEWDWKADGGHNCNPIVDRNGRVKVDDSTQAPIRKWGLRVERDLPFRAALAADSTAEAEFEKPFVLLFDSATQKWVQAHHSSGGTRVALTPLDADLGFKIDFSPNHRLAKGSWTGAKPSKVDPDKDAGCFDWRKMQATVAVRTDRRLSVELDIDKSEALKDRVLHIEVPDAELHYVVPGTVKSIGGPPDNPFVLTTKDDALARDDGERLRKIAALARAWYGRDRASLTLTVQDVWRQYPVGCLILSTGAAMTGGLPSPAGAGKRDKAQNVNTVVTQIVYDLVRSTTTLRTSFAELDVTPGRGGAARL